jgi:hypothetical protein
MSTDEEKSRVRLSPRRFFANARRLLCRLRKEDDPTGFNRLQ